MVSVRVDMETVLSSGPGEVSGHHSFLQLLVPSSVLPCFLNAAQIGSIHRTDTRVFIGCAGVWEVAHHK